MSRQRVLIVDDDHSIRELFKKALGNRYDVDSAADGDRGLEAVTADTACVIADQMMPGLTGVELLEQVAARFPKAARVLITASDRVKDLALAVNVARVHRFLAKPVRIAELVQSIDEAVKGAQLEEENLRLVAELLDKNLLLTKALAAVQESERRLEREVAHRTAELRRANAELEKLALRDGLTGLYNHRFFQEALTQELGRAARYRHPVGLIFLDVDHFKNYNDMMGHPAGDEVLRQVARFLDVTEDAPEIKFRGRVSDIAARYGGEEFVVILPMTDREGAAVRAERLRTMIADHAFPRRDVQPGGQVTVSVGVAAYPDDALDKVGLIEAADAATLRAKREGRNRVVQAAPIATTKAP